MAIKAEKYWKKAGRERQVLFAPSLLGADPLCIGADVDRLKGCYDWLHLDIMDGHFVHNLSFGPAVARALRRRYLDVFIDAHLMLHPNGERPLRDGSLPTNICRHSLDRRSVV